MFPRIEIPPVVLGETRRVEFDFQDGLTAGETISSQSVTVRTLSGTDPAPSSIKNGSASQANGVVTQKFTPTIEGVLYEIRAQANTSLSQVLYKIGILAVPMLTTDEGVAQVSGLNVISSYDSGNMTVSLAPTPILTADQTAAGGLFQINVYMVLVVPSGGVGTLNANLDFTDDTTGIAESRALAPGVLTAGSAGSNMGDIETVNPEPSTQVLLSVVINGTPGPLTYRIQAEVIRL